MNRSYAVVSGIVLVALGLAFFFGPSDALEYLTRYWWVPVVLIAALGLFNTAWQARKKDGNASLQMLIAPIAMIVVAGGAVFSSGPEWVPIIMAGLMIAAGVLLLVGRR
jgi:hypothetical protein